MNRKAFTLAELLAVISLLVIILLLILPSIGSKLDKKKEEIAKIDIDLIEAAAQEYARAEIDSSNFIKCIKIEELVKKEYIDKTISKKIELTHFVKIEKYNEKITSKYSNDQCNES